MKFDRDFRKYIKIFGYVPVSLLDYPGEITSMFYSKYCTMSCSYCHNYESMNRLLAYDEIQLDYCIKDAILSLTTAITLSGGEFLLFGKDAIAMLKHFRKLTDKKLKIDTNGTLPEVLEEILDQKLVDFVAMDVKGHFENYSKFGYKQDVNNLYRSADLIRQSGVDHQFRTTIDKSLFDDQDRDFIMKYFPSIKFQNKIEREKHDETHSSID